MKDASSQAVKGSGSKVQCRRVHRIAVASFLGGLGLAWLAAITAWTLSRQLGVVGLQLTHVELDSSSSRELALLKVIGEMAGWTQPHKLSLLEDSHCAVFADEDDASMVNLQLMGVQEDGEQLTLQLEAAFGSEDGEEVQPLLKRAGNFLVKCHLHFDVNIFNTGLSFRTEHVVEKDPTEDSGKPGSAKTHFDFVCKNWEIRKPSSPDFTAVAEAVYFVEFDIPHGRFEVLTRFFEEVSVIVKADLDYFVEHSPAAEVEVAVDGRVVARRSNTSTVISIPARVTWKMDAQVMVDLASGISGHIYNGERSPGGRTVHRSKFGLVSKAPRSAVARAAGPFHELDVVTEERGLHMATSDLPRLLPPRRLEPGSSGDEGEMPQEQRDIEFKSSLFIDNSAWFVLDMGITEEEFVMFFEVRQIADDYTTRVEASVTNASDHSNASFRYHDKGGMTIDFGFAVDDRHARVDFEKNCSFTQRKTIRAFFGEVETPCETQEPIKGNVGIELDATWSDFLDMLSDWVHRNNSAASEDSQGSPQSPTGPPALSGAPKPQVVTSRAWARWEHVRRHEQLGQDTYVALSWLQNFSRERKSFGSIGLEVHLGEEANFADYVSAGLSPLGSILKTDGWMPGPLVLGHFRVVSTLEWDHSNASILKVQGSTDVLSKCPTDAAGFVEVGRLASLDGYAFPQSMLENARCGKCRYATSEGSGLSSPTRTEGWNVTEFGEQYWVENQLTCPDPSSPPVDYEVPFGWPVEERSCCSVNQVLQQLNLTDGDSHTFRVEIPMNDEYERTDGQTSWGLLQGRSTDITDSVMVIIGTLVDVMANWTGTPLTMPKFHDPWRQNSTIRSLLNHSVNFVGYELVLLDALDAMGMNLFLDESYLKTSEQWEDNAMTRTIELGVNDAKILLKKTNHTADDRFVLVQANLSGEPKFSAILNQSRDVPAQKTTVRYQHVIMDGANTTSVGAQVDVTDLPMDRKNWEVSLNNNQDGIGLHASTGLDFAEGIVRVNGDLLGNFVVNWTDEGGSVNNLTARIMDTDSNTATVAVVSDSQVEPTKLQLNFSDSIFTQLNGTLSLNSMDDFLSVDGALMDRNLSTTRVTVVGDAKANDTKFQLNFSDPIWTEVGIGLSLNSMNDFLSVDGALMDRNLNTTRVTVVVDAKANDTKFQLNFTSDTIWTEVGIGLSLNSMDDFLSVDGALKDNNSKTTRVTMLADAKANDTKFKLNVSDSIWTEVGIGLSLNSMDDFLSVDGTLMDSNLKTTRVTATSVTVVSDAKANDTKFQLNISDSIWTEVGIGLSLHSMDNFSGFSGTLRDRDGNAAWVTAVADSQGNDTEFQLNFSDLILTKHDGTLSLHSMNNFLSVSGALRDSLVPNATNLSFDLRFSQVDLLFFHLIVKDDFTDRLVASVVETAVGEQRVFNFVHEDHLLSNTQSTGRLSTGGPSMLDSTIRLKAPATAETATILSLMLVQDNVTAEQPALAVVNMTSEETGHMLTAWFSGMQANNVTKGDLGFNIFDQVLVSSKLVAGNGTLHMALNFTEGDSGLKEFFCDANEIAGGLDSLIFYKDRGSEKVKLAMRLGDAPSVHNPVPRGFFFSIPDVSISVNISESSEKNNFFDVNASIIGSEVSGRMYYSAQKALMLEFLDDDGVASTTVSLFLSSVEVRRSGFPLESSWLARLRISRAGELEDETIEVVTFHRGQSPLQTSQHSVIVLTRWSDMFPRSVAQHFSLAEIALQSQIYERKASVAAEFSGFTCTATQVSKDFLANATLWWTGEDAALSVLAWSGGILKLNMQVDIPRMSSTPTTLITTTGMLTITTEADTTVEVTTTGGSLAPSPQTKVVIQMALTMEDVTEFDQTALEASLNKELTNAGEEASFRIVSVDYTVKVEYTFAAIMDEMHIRQALANIHGVDISQVSVQFKRRLQGPMSKLWPSRLLQSASAAEATILTSDPTQVSTMKIQAASPASLATELTSISGEQVPVPEVSAVPEASVEVVAEIIVNGGSVAPSLLSQTAVSQMVSRAAQDAGFAAPVRVEEPMIVTESTSTTVTTGTGDSESGCLQVTPSIASAILLLSWVA